MLVLPSAPSLGSLGEAECRHLTFTPARSVAHGGGRKPGLGPAGATEGADRGSGQGEPPAGSLSPGGGPVQSRAGVSALEGGQVGTRAQTGCGSRSGRGKRRGLRGPHWALSWEAGSSAHRQVPSRWCLHSHSPGA